MSRRSAPASRSRASLAPRTWSAGLALGLALTTAYAVPPASATAAEAALRPAAGAVSPAVTGPVCQPWQTQQAVPRGVSLKPRVFPTPEPVATSSGAGTTVVCRNAPPVPFTHPAWDPATVVGGSALGESGVITDRQTGVPEPPAVYDVSYVLADLDSGEILAAKSPHAWLRPASTLKTLTALTLMPLLDPKQVVVAGPDAQDAAGSRVGILAGNRYPVSSLFDAMLMFSANDAVYALADAAGGYDRTVSLMNQEAARIGAHDTLTVDPSGLDDGDQRSSAYDLALIGRDAMRLPQFRSTIVKRDAVFPGGKDKSGKVWPAFHVYNINELLAHYPGTIGIKPGRTDRAQHTFIGAATRDGRTLLVSQMGSVTGSWEPTAALLDWGFAHADQLRPVGQLVEPGQAPAPTAVVLPRLPTNGAGAAGSGGSSQGRAGGADTGTPTPADDLAGLADARSVGALLVPAGAGAVVTLGLAVLVVLHRRRPRLHRRRPRLRRRRSRLRR
ncbi:hypothetical protein [Terrabacter sp. NPDC080008]|uniref:D-alanyl-D-alanine carboxypeptidase family protein n=1 Tax=Terrabacter sp. NPDC080008 TaxID=3155176 RepID=UPI0034502374